MDALWTLLQTEPAAQTAVVGVLLSVGIALWRWLKKGETEEQVAAVRTSWLVFLAPFVSAVVATAAAGWNWAEFGWAVLAAWAASQTTYQTGKLALRATVAKAVPPVTAGLVVCLLLVTMPVAARDLSVAGGLTFAGKALSYDVQASYPLFLEPTINLKLLYAPEVDEVAVAGSTPVRTFTDPLGRWLRWTPAPWVTELAGKVEVGLAVWKTEEKFPVQGGLFWSVNVLGWDF